MIPAREALQRLRDGNRRFVDDNRSSESLISPRRRIELAAGQAPFAAILGCSDSRVPVEIVFDQGLGDLFVIRVAGNIVAPSQIGSVEFVAERFKTRLVVVLGHSKCGVIQAPLELRPNGYIGVFDAHIGAWRQITNHGQEAQQAGVGSRLERRGTARNRWLTSNFGWSP